MNEVVTNRNFNVPVELLFRAWARPEHIKNWWGPNGFTNTFYEFDFRPGGYWRFTMHGPDGKNYENESRFELREENKRIVLEHISPPKFRADVLFRKEKNNLTSLEWKMIFEDEKTFLALKDFIAEKNEENLDRLEAELIKMKANDAGR